MSVPLSCQTGKQLNRIYVQFGHYLVTDKWFLYDVKDRKHTTRTLFWRRRKKTRKMECEGNQRCHIGAADNPSLPESYATQKGKLLHMAHRREVMLVAVGPAGRPARPRPTALLPPRSYGKPVAAAAVYRLLMMMGIRMPETCWAVSKPQAINLLLIAASSWLSHLNFKSNMIND